MSYTRIPLYVVRLTKTTNSHPVYLGVFDSGHDFGGFAFHISEAHRFFEKEKAEAAGRDSGVEFKVVRLKVKS